MNCALNMACKYCDEIHLKDVVLDEIEKKLSEFNGYGSPGDYLDWEFYVDLYVGNFLHSSCKLEAVIAKKLVGHTELWWRVHMI